MCLTLLSTEAQSNNPLIRWRDQSHSSRQNYIRNYNNPPNSFSNTPCEKSDMTELFLHKSLIEKKRKKSMVDAGRVVSHVVFNNYTGRQDSEARRTVLNALLTM